MIKETRNYIREALANANSPALLCSFGKESLVLLKLAREVRPDISILWFGDSLSTFGESVIRENDLQVFSYPPADRYLVPNGDGYSLIDEYSFGQTRVPLISDLVASDQCEIETLSTLRKPFFGYGADVTLWGFRQEDRHSLVDTVFPRQFQLGQTMMVAPLYDWSESDIFAAIEELRIPYEPETNHIGVCSECLEQITATVGEDSLTAFQERFNWRSH